MARRPEALSDLRRPAEQRVALKRENGDSHAVGQSGRRLFYCLDIWRGLIQYSTMNDTDIGNKIQ
ncbi:MAG: hypothetical protein DWQ37_09865 [Planctomycetota bacterium]|nr:MAG: hypothetical protein DWQ37_09865 [Planctomycetota bacterium]